MKPEPKRLQCHIKPEIVEWIATICESRDISQADVGTEALLLYIPGYMWCPSWVLIEDILDTPKEDRNDYKVEAWAAPSYIDWLGTLPDTALDYLFDLGRKSELEEKYYKGVFLKIKGEALHLRRALLLYYYTVQSYPEVLNYSLDRIRPEGYQKPHDFNNTGYIREYGAKVLQMTGIDFSKPPKQ